MSENDKDQTTSENTGDEETTSAETPELSEDGKEKVRQMQHAYDEDRPTVVLPSGLVPPAHFQVMLAKYSSHFGS